MMENPSTSTIVPGGVSKKKLHGIYDGEYFQVLLQDREKDLLIVQCNSCPPSLQLRTSIRSNGNIIKHIQRRHPELLSKIRMEKNIKSRRPLRANSTFCEPSNQKETKCNNLVEDGSEQTCSNYSHCSNILPPKKEQKEFLNIETCQSNHNSNDKLYLDDPIGETEIEYVIDDEDNADDINLSFMDHEKTKNWTSEKINTNLSGEVIALQKELMLREFEDIQDMRRQKHRLEIEILRQDLEFKKIEHRKKLELLNKRLLKH